MYRIKQYFLTIFIFFLAAKVWASDYHVKTGDVPAIGTNIGSAGNPGTLTQLNVFLENYKSSEILYVYVAPGEYTIPKSGIVVNTYYSPNPPGQGEWFGIDVRFVPMDNNNPPVFKVSKIMFDLSNYVKVTVDNVIIKGTGASTVSPFFSLAPARLIMRNTTVTGFTVNFSAKNTSYLGCGLFTMASANLYLTNCVISNNTVTGTTTGYNDINNVSLIYSPFTQIFIDGTMFDGNKVQTGSTTVLPTMISSFRANVRVLNSTFKSNSFIVPANSTVAYLPAISYAETPSVYINFINNTIRGNSYATQSGKTPLDIYTKGTGNGFTKVINNTMEKGVRIDDADKNDMVVNNIIFGNEATTDGPIYVPYDNFFMRPMATVLRNAFNYKRYNKPDGLFEPEAGVDNGNVYFGGTIDNFLSGTETVPGKKAEALKLVDYNNYTLLEMGGNRNDFRNDFDVAGDAGDPCSPDRALVPDLYNCAKNVASFLQYDQLGRLRPTWVSLGAWDWVPVQPVDDPLTTQLNATVTVKPLANDIISSNNTLTVSFDKPTDLSGKELSIAEPTTTELSTQYGKYKLTGTGKDIELTYTAPAFDGSVTAGATQIPTSVIVFPYTISDGTDSRSGRVLVFVVEDAGGKPLLCNGDSYTIELRKQSYTAFQIYDNKGKVSNNPFYNIPNVNNTVLEVKPRIITHQNKNITNTDDSLIDFPRTRFTIRANDPIATGSMFRIPNLM